MTAVLSLKPVKSLVGHFQRKPRPAVSVPAIQREESSAATILHVHGRLATEQVGVFYDHVEKALERGAPRLVVDLAACPFIDSAGIAALVTALQRVRQARQEFALADLNPQVVTALKMARLLEVFTIHATLAEALTDSPALGIIGRE